MFSYEFCEISKNTFFTEHLWTIASDFWKPDPELLLDASTMNACCVWSRINVLMFSLNKVFLRQTFYSCLMKTSVDICFDFLVQHDWKKGIVSL